MYLRAAAMLTGPVSSWGSAKRKKYHDESTNVSIVSVSRTAGFPHFGQFTRKKPSWLLRGDSPVGRNSTSSGKRIGNSSAGAGTMPSVGQ